MAKKKYQLDREQFINYYPTIITDMIRYHTVRENLIKGSEFILTTDDMLQSVGWIAGKLLGVNAPVHFSDVELIYTPKS